LYVEANEPSIENRRIKLGMQYAAKLKAYPSNPAHDCVFNPLYENVYDTLLYHHPLNHQYILQSIQMLPI
jgi:hypothetical protein